jgi:hypothetical protein
MCEPEDLGSIDVLLPHWGTGARTFSGALAGELAVLAEAGFTKVAGTRALVKDVAGDEADFVLDEVPGDDQISVPAPSRRPVVTARDLAHIATAPACGGTAGDVACRNAWPWSLGRTLGRSGGRALALDRVATWGAAR